MIEKVTIYDIAKKLLFDLFGAEVAGNARAMGYFWQYQEPIDASDFGFERIYTDEIYIIINGYETKEYYIKNNIYLDEYQKWYQERESTNYIEGSVIDLTHLQKASKAIKQSEEKYRLIFEESND